MTSKMTGGWIKLYRCLMDDPIWLNSTVEQKVILITLLLMANHAENKWEWKGKPFICKPGQMVTSLKSIRKNCRSDISIMKIRVALKRFENFGFLTNQSTKHNRLITICNWSIYQSKDYLDNKAYNNQLTMAQQSGNNQIATNKNVKNEKNEKKYPSSFSSNKFFSFREMELERIKEANEQAMKEFLEDD